MRALCFLALLTGCSNLLGIHQLDDAGPGDGKTSDGQLRDSTVPSDTMPDGTMTTVVHIGEYTPLGVYTAVPGNYIIARQFSVGGTTVITGAGAYLSSETPNGHIRFGIYNDNANAPLSKRIASAADITLDGTPGYNEGPLGPHTLPAGTYWMVIATDSSIELGSADTNNVTGAAASLPFSGAFPSNYNPQPTSVTNADRVNLYLQAQP